MTELIIVDKIFADVGQKIMINAFQGQSDLVGQGRYIIINLPPWIYYRHNIKLEEEAA